MQSVPAANSYLYSRSRYPAFGVSGLEVGEAESVEPGRSVLLAGQWGPRTVSDVENADGRMAFIHSVDNSVYRWLLPEK